MKSNATFGVYEAETCFSELVERVNRGEVITITQHEKPIAQLVPFNRPSHADIKDAFRQLDQIASRHPLNPAGNEKISYRELIDAGRLLPESG